MHGRLPPLTALRAFEAAARHLSFAKAAEELHVTPAALSYQIKVLEEHLETPLFRRLNRAVALTEAGRVLAPRASAGFAALTEGVRAVARLSEGASLTVTAGPAFTAKWLAPRFFRFASIHPEIELRFVASLKLMDFDRDGVDAAIRFGMTEPEGLFSVTLIEEFVVPVAAPEVAQRLTTPEDVARAPLFHDDSVAHLLPALGWPAWCRAAGLGERPEAARGPRFSNADHAIDGAAEGGGLALARGSLAERDIAAGRLAIPVPLGLRLPAQFRFVCKPGVETVERVATFLSWLREETAGVAALRERVTLLAMAADGTVSPAAEVP
ncbi:MAG: transcriptional regulator GcvA [Pseudomonadota bacterium]